MRKPAVILATALSTVALAGVIGVGVAAADPTPAPSATPSSTAAPTAGATPTAKPTKPGKAGKANKKRDLTQRALHGEVTLGGKKHQVVDFQRGMVSAVSTSSITDPQHRRLLGDVRGRREDQGPPRQGEGRDRRREDRRQGPGGRN